MSQPSRSQTARRQATPEEAKALAHPDRLRIIRLTFDEALTNKELADRLDRNPGTTLYHLRMLVATGFVAAEDARARREGRRRGSLPIDREVVDARCRRARSRCDRAMVDAFRAELLESPVDTSHGQPARASPLARPAGRARSPIEALVEEAASWPRGSTMASLGRSSSRCTSGPLVAGSGSRGDAGLP